MVYAIDTEDCMEMRTVQEVNKQKRISLQKLKVAAYARVSTGKDAMLHSLSAQVSHYSKLIQNRMDWEYVGVYSDEGISGTSESRAGFQNLLKDARDGKIDLVLTKSISRFARNTVILLEVIRELKQLGVAVYFEREKINSLSGDGELLLTLLASFAQEESLSARLNKKWSIQKQFERGELVGLSHLYGYEIKNGELIINSQEAEVLRMIYAEYLSGSSAKEIATKLNQLGIKRKRGGQWKPHDISMLFLNEKHTGDSLLQKTYKDEAVCSRLRRNRGEKNQYFVEGTHEAIIDHETYEAVRAEVKRRRPHQTTPPYVKYPFRKKIRCGQCGAPFNRKKTKTETFWRCAANLGMRDHRCDMKGVPERVLEGLVAEALNMEQFDASAFSEQIKEIIVPEANRVTIVFRNGKEKHFTWQDRSRSESWTPEMRARVSQQNYNRRKKDHDSTSQKSNCHQSEKRNPINDR